MVGRRLFGSCGILQLRAEAEAFLKENSNALPQDLPGKFEWHNLIEVDEPVPDISNISGAESRILFFGLVFQYFVNSFPTSLVVPNLWKHPGGCLLTGAYLFIIHH